MKYLKLFLINLSQIIVPILAVLLFMIPFILIAVHIKSPAAQIISIFVYGCIGAAAVETIIGEL